MFLKSEQYYDDIYLALGKNYSVEADKVHRLIQKHKKSKGKFLLDVACGTGLHAGYLSKNYEVEGLDLDARMLSLARRKHPKLRFTQGDMTSFKLGHQFDAIVCLFSSIGYVKTKSKLQKAIKTMDQHLLLGGVLLIEPWFTPKQWKPGRVYTFHVDKPDRKIVRMSHSGQRDRISVLEFQYLIGTSKGVEHSKEIHELGLFTHKEYLDAFKAAGLSVIYDPKGLDGRGLYIAKKAVNKQ